MLLSGCAPFDTSDAQLEERQVCMGSWSFEHANWQAVSAEAKATVDSMLQVDVSRRASAAMVLRSAWVRRHGRRARVPSMGPGTKLSSPPGERRRRVTEAAGTSLAASIKALNSLPRRTTGAT